MELAFILMVFIPPFAIGCISLLWVKSNRGLLLSSVIAVGMGLIIRWNELDYYENMGFLGDGHFGGIQFFLGYCLVAGMIATIVTKLYVRWFRSFGKPRSSTQSTPRSRDRVRPRNQKSRHSIPLE